MTENRITQLFGIEYPIVQAGMIWNSGWRLASAVSNAGGLGSLGALPVAIVVWVIGLSLGGTTGYAINPARDLGPRIMHAILPIKNKHHSDWSYAWIPVLGPIAGGVVAALIYLALL